MNGLLFAALLALALALGGCSTAAPSERPPELEFRPGQGIVDRNTNQTRTPEEALRWARRDLQTRRTVATISAMAWALYHAGRPGEAAANMDKALRVKTIDPDVLYRAGLIYPAAGDANRGRLYLRQAAAANPQFQEFHFFR